MNSKLNALKTIIYRANLTNNPKAFFPLFNKFGQWIFQNSCFQPIIDKIIKEGKKVATSMQNLADNALIELTTHEKKIYSYILDNKVNNQWVTKLLKAFQDPDQHKNDIYLKLSFLDEALCSLLNDDSHDHSPFVKTFGNIKQINDFKFIDKNEVFPNSQTYINESFYLTQKQELTAWYSLNQLLAFAEKYDWEFYDKLIKKLKAEGKDIVQLEKAYQALFEYVNFDKPTPLFPTIEEYKNYMLQIYLYIQDNLFNSNTNTLDSVVHTYSYASETGELTIDNEKPIKYKTNNNPAKLIDIRLNRKKMLTYTEAYNLLGLYEYKKIKDISPTEIKELESIIRYVNDPFCRKNKPKFLITQKSKTSLREKEILVSASYKPR